MMENSLIVFFDPPFWVGIFEQSDADTYRVARHVFGAEPTEPQLLELARHGFKDLIFTNPVDLVSVEKHEVGYKRRMREIRAAMKHPAASTRSQQILQQEMERQAQNHRDHHRQIRQLSDDLKYQSRKAKKAEKHRGH